MEGEGAQLNARYNERPRKGTGQAAGATPADAAAVCLNVPRGHVSRPSETPARSCGTVGLLPGQTEDPFKKADAHAVNQRARSPVCRAAGQELFHDRAAGL